MGTITGNGTAVTGLGGPEGYGETALPRGDDSYARIDVSAVFEQGFVIGGTYYAANDVYVSTDGFVTFGSGVLAMPANPSSLTMPFLAIFMADVDTRIDGEGPESGQIWLDVDSVNDVVTITWDDVGFYRRDASKTDTFQMQLFDRGGGAMDVVYRYENIDWTTGDLQGGSAGLGGTPAFIGYRTTTKGAPVAIAASGNGAAELNLPSTPGNTGVIGLYVFRIGGAALPIEGSAGNDTMQGTPDADVIHALGGDDWIFASGGADTVDGGSGQDVLDFSAAPGAVALNLATPGASSGWAGGLMLAGLESFIASHFADTLTGAAGNDWFDGWSGNDRLTGNAGADSLIGHDGNDSLYGGAGADRLEGGAGADQGYGGDQGDTLLGGAGADTLTGDNDADSLDGGSEADRLTGGAGADTLAGRAGIDSLYGGDGNDTLQGGADADRLEGGPGIDKADYAGAPAGVRVDLTTPGSSVGWAMGDTFLGIEVLGGTGYGDTLRGAAANETLWGMNGNDSLDGMGGANALYGGSGNDTLAATGGNDLLSGDAGLDRLTGQGGSDSLYGGDGDDTLNGGAGADRLEGGAGRDRVEYLGAPAGVVLDLSAPAGSTGWAAGDSLIGIEIVVGTGYGDTLRGAGPGETFFGGNGNDLLNGMAGNNALNGDSGNDTLQGGSGLDTLSGGAGSDSLSGNDAADLIQGGTGLDTAYGGNANDTLWGQGDADFLFGGAGADFLSGDAGADTLTGGPEGDVFYSAGTAGLGADLVQDYSNAQGDILRIGIAGLVAGNFTVTYATAKGVGLDSVAEAYIRLNATGEVIWIVADGAASGSFLVQSMSAVPYWLT